MTELNLEEGKYYEAKGGYIFKALDAVSFFKSRGIACNGLQAENPYPNVLREVTMTGVPLRRAHTHADYIAEYEHYAATNPEEKYK